MKWSQAHVGNIRQAPEEDQEAVNPDIKVPDEQNPLVDDEEEVVGTPQRRDADTTPKADAPKADAPKDKPSPHVEPSGHAESKK